MTRTLLFGDDGSPGADVAWLWINSHVWADWAIEVLNAEVRDEPPAPRELVRPDAAASLTTIHAPGDPRFELHTRGVDRDLLVVGARGRGLLKRLHLGSTAEWLMHAPSAPLVIARTGRPTHRILLAHDGSAHALAAEESLGRLPWIGQAEVLVVSLQEGQDDRDVAGSAARRLAGVAANAEAQAVTAQELPVFSRPRDLILDRAVSWRADLIALGTRGLTPWESFTEMGLHRAGSTATAVARNAEVNVLIAQAPPSAG